MTRLVIHADLGLLQSSAAVVVIVVVRRNIIDRRIVVVLVEVLAQWNPLRLLRLLLRSDDGIELVFYLVVGSFRI